MRGVTSQGSSAPNANNPSDPAIRRGANPTRSLGAPARWAERRQAQPLSPWKVRAWERLGPIRPRELPPQERRNNCAHFEPPSDSEWEATGAPINRA